MYGITSDEDSGGTCWSREDNLVSTMEDIEEVNNGLYKVGFPCASHSTNVHEQLWAAEANMPCYYLKGAKLFDIVL